MNLSNLKPGQQGTILKLDSGIGPIRRRLMDMGVIPGELIKVEKVAPMGDPIEVTVKGYNLSLRKGEAKGIEIEEVVA
jgi:ferrous iron transport protein A